MRQKRQERKKNNYVTTADNLMFKTLFQVSLADLRKSLPAAFTQTPPNIYIVRQQDMTNIRQKSSCFY